MEKTGIDDSQLTFEDCINTKNYKQLYELYTKKRLSISPEELENYVPKIRSDVLVMLLQKNFPQAQYAAAFSDMYDVLFQYLENNKYTQAIQYCSVLLDEENWPHAKEMIEECTSSTTSTKSNKTAKTIIENRVVLHILRKALRYSSNEDPNRSEANTIEKLLQAVPYKRFNNINSIYDNNAAQQKAITECYLFLHEQRGLYGLIREIDKAYHIEQKRGMITDALKGLQKTNEEEITPLIVFWMEKIVSQLLAYKDAQDVSYLNHYLGLLKEFEVQGIEILERCVNQPTDNELKYSCINYYYTYLKSKPIYQQKVERLSDSLANYFLMHRQYDLLNKWVKEHGITMTPLQTSKIVCNMASMLIAGNVTELKSIVAMLPKDIDLPDSIKALDSNIPTEAKLIAIEECSKYLKARKLVSTSKMLVKQCLGTLQLEMLQKLIDKGSVDKQDIKPEDVIRVILINAAQNKGADAIRELKEWLPENEEYKKLREGMSDVQKLRAVCIAESYKLLQSTKRPPTSLQVVDTCLVHNLGAVIVELIEQEETVVTESDLSNENILYERVKELCELYNTGESCDDESVPAIITLIELYKHYELFNKSDEQQQLLLVKILMLSAHNDGITKNMRRKICTKLLEHITEEEMFPSILKICKDFFPEDTRMHAFVFYVHTLQQLLPSQAKILAQKEGDFIVKYLKNKDNGAGIQSMLSALIDVDIDRENKKKEFHYSNLIKYLLRENVIKPSDIFSSVGCIIEESDIVWEDKDVKFMVRQYFDDPASLSVKEKRDIALICFKYGIPLVQILSLFNIGAMQFLEYDSNETEPFNSVLELRNRISEQQEAWPNRSINKCLLDNVHTFVRNFNRVYDIATEPTEVSSLWALQSALGNVKRKLIANNSKKDNVLVVKINKILEDTTNIFLHYHHCSSELAYWVSALGKGVKIQYLLDLADIVDDGVYTRKQREKGRLKSSLKAAITTNMQWSSLSETEQQEALNHLNKRIKEYGADADGTLHQELLTEFQKTKTSACSVPSQQELPHKSDVKEGKLSRIQQLFKGSKLSIPKFKGKRREKVDSTHFYLPLTASIKGDAGGAPLPSENYKDVTNGLFRIGLPGKGMLTLEPSTRSSNLDEGLEDDSTDDIRIKNNLMQGSLPGLDVFRYNPLCEFFDLGDYPEDFSDFVESQHMGQTSLPGQEGVFRCNPLGGLDGNTSFNLLGEGEKNHKNTCKSHASSTTTTSMSSVAILNAPLGTPRTPTTNIGSSKSTTTHVHGQASNSVR